MAEPVATGHLLLWDEPPLLLRPTLALILLHNEITPADRCAIVLQQVNYWTVWQRKHGDPTKNFKNGRWWVYNSIKKWNLQFPFWSKNTVERCFGKLVDCGLFLTANFNAWACDRTIWYAIDYDLVGEWYLAWAAVQEAEAPSPQSGEMENLTLGLRVPPNGGDGEPQNGENDSPTVVEPIPETTHETSLREIHETWSAVCAEMELSMTRAAFGQYVVPLSLVSLSTGPGRADVTLGTIYPWLADWVRDDGASVHLRRTIAGVVGVPLADLRLTVEEESDVEGKAI